MSAKKTRRCANCGGTLLHKRVQVDQHWGEDIVVFENVPADVCATCDQVWLGSRVLKEIQKVLGKNKKPSRKISVPVWSLHQVTA